MNLKNIYHFLFVAVILAMTACTTDPEEIFTDDNVPPTGALPSTEFTLNNLPDEPYAEDAIRVVATDDNAPFYAIELMPDGHYLFSTHRPYDYNTASVNIVSTENEGLSISKKRRNRSGSTRSVEDNNGTFLILPNEEYYGEFTKLGNKQYRLSNGYEIDLTDVTGSDKKISYRGLDGRISNVYVSVSEPANDKEVKSLCRTWNNNSFELWAYWNGHYVFHGKQTLNNGIVDTNFSVMGEELFEKDDFLDDDDVFCYKVIFTTVGTYLCFYLDGEVEVSRWKWANKSQGTLYYNHSDYDGDYEGDGFVTVRFAGNQMRVYEDYTDSENAGYMRIVAVNTLTAAN